MHQRRVWGWLSPHVVFIGNLPLHLSWFSLLCSRVHPSFVYPSVCISLSLSHHALCAWKWLFPPITSVPSYANITGRAARRVPSQVPDIETGFEIRGRLFKYLNMELPPAPASRRVLLWLRRPGFPRSIANEAAVVNVIRSYGLEYTYVACTVAVMSCAPRRAALPLLVMLSTLAQRSVVQLLPCVRILLRSSPDCRCCHVFWSAASFTGTTSSTTRVRLSDRTRSGSRSRCSRRTASW